MSNTYNKSFYAHLPPSVCDKLDLKILLYGEKSWFPDAFKEYEKIVREKRISRDIPDVDAFFEDAERNAMFGIEPEDGITFSEKNGYSFSEIFGDDPFAHKYKQGGSNEKD